MGSPVPVVPFRKPYDWKVGLWKGAKTAALFATPLLLEALSKDATVAALLPEAWREWAVVIALGARVALNRKKQQG